MMKRSGCSGHGSRGISFTISWIGWGRRHPKNSEENGASCADLHQNESKCTHECARGDSNSHPLRDWILSPARRSRKGRSNLKLRDHAPVEVPTLVPRKSTRFCASFTPELAQIIDAW